MNYPFRPVIFFVFVLHLLFASSQSMAQLRYGNEWINFQQKYYKIQLCKDGIYKISYKDLKKAEIPADSLHPGRFQLFFRGVEQYIFIEGGADGKFNSTDRILFYGQKNDGVLDEPMYSNPSDQHHKFFSLYTDSSFYFLTWTKNPVDTNNLRMQDFNQSNYTAYNAETLLPFEKYYTFNEQYYDGTPIIALSNINRSVLTFGEGWLSRSILNSQNRSVSIDVPGISLAKNQVTAQILAFGKSEAQSFSGNDHQLQITAGGKPLMDSLFKGFAVINSTFSLANNQVDSLAEKITFSFSSPQISGVAASQTALSFIRLDYDLKPDLHNNSVFAFSFTHQTSGIRYLKFNNYPSVKKQAVLFDLSNHRKIACSKNQDSIKILLPFSTTKQLLYLCDTADFTITELKEVQFSQYPSSTLNKSFIIITHPTLIKSALKYAEYRDSKGYSTFIAETQQLYDQFYFGYHHPLAIRHFLDYVWQTSAIKPTYLLLLGKGLENDLVRNPIKAYPDPLDLVPAIGFPCTDIYFSSGIDLNKPKINEQQIIPALATGRIAASSDSMVFSYLSKLKEYESSADEIWKKNILHIGGEQVGIQDNLKAAKTIATSLPFGGNVQEIFNQKDDPVVFDFKNDIQKSINGGLSMLTYFAHGSLNVLGIDMGQATDLKNKGKYPIMYMNGCNVGNPNSNFSLGEEYIFAPDKGAIAWLAHNTTTFIPILGTQINGFYNELLKNSYTQSVAMAMKILIAKVNTSILPDREFYQQWIFQGDPALQVYKPLQPDYYPDTASVSFNPEMIFTTTDSFNIKIGVLNKGKSVDGVISLKIDRTMPDKTIRTYFYNNLTAPYYADTFSFNIETGGKKAQGINKFKITVNSTKSVSESVYSNNFFTTDYFFSGSGVDLMMPLEFSIVPNDSATIIIQNRNILDKVNRSYIVQLDSSPVFNSPELHQLPTTTTDESIISWNFHFPMRDSTVYYWRAKVLNIDTSKEEWESSSFIYIKNSSAGWSQSHFPQFHKDGFTNIVADSIHRKFQFSNFSRQLSVSASRWTHSNRGIKLDYTLSLNPGVCSNHNLVIIRFDSKTLLPSEINRRCNGDSDVNYRSFNMFVSQNQDSLANYINSIPDGDYVAVFTRYAVNFPNWQNNVYVAFDKIGASPLLRGIKNDLSAYVLIGRKENSVGVTIAEDTVFEAKPPTDLNNSKTVSITGPISGAWYAGTITSPIIGPSIAWGKIHFNLRGADVAGADSFNLSIIGIDQNGKDSILKSNLNQQDSDLSFIDAAIYPKLKLSLNLNDILNRTPIQLKRWQVTYNLFPEGSIFNNQDFSYHADSLTEGDTFRFSIPFRNISSLKMDSLLVKYSFIHENQVVYNRYHRFGALSSGNYVVYSDQISTIGRSGQNKINIMFNPDNDQPEMFLNNNSLSIPFVVYPDNANPLLDVTFDGRHIMNGEIVSAKPSIIITSRDENRILQQNDTTAFEIFLKMPDGKPFRRFWFSENKLTFYPAKDSFNTAMASLKPGLLADGTYSLKVQSFDKSGNAAASRPYQIDFNVINHSRINDVIAFPNPFSDKLHFRFTITGYTIPTEIIIRIIALDGRLVKEIQLPENNKFFIGQNTITNAWDGTDKAGSIVQNGLYFYQMVVRQFSPGTTTANSQLYLLAKGKIILIR